MGDAVGVGVGGGVGERNGARVEGARNRVACRGDGVGVAYDTRRVDRLGVWDAFDSIAYGLSLRSGACTANPILFHATWKNGRIG